MEFAAEDNKNKNINSAHLHNWSRRCHISRSIPRFHNSLAGPLIARTVAWAWTLVIIQWFVYCSLPSQNYQCIGLRSIKHQRREFAGIGFNEIYTNVQTAMSPYYCRIGRFCEESCQTARASPSSVPRGYELLDGTHASLEIQVFPIPSMQCCRVKAF